MFSLPAPSNDVASTLKLATAHYICYEQCDIHELSMSMCTSASRLQCKTGASVSHVSLAKKMPVVVHASAEAGPTDAAEQPEKPKPVASIEDMPFESKQRMILEQRARMKVAKKLRQRRKRLVQKRRLRKKGRWPPSKMKKLKNV
ncbi:hypothetical protein CFC21_035167 [Triticum aestivum]|uniref:50S ribosomal protein 5, chloroplastic n=3 Tax=Triticum TaxID=4564 RepID=A0A9R0RIP9_TRITD|nr:hypothetical protein CFC21_035167 [Triticum aestivum]VAH60379.1 unnamed protein product [Triticum turgidum subsp. durum]